ncbi:hypothetical protein V8C86DRAFT_2454061, partial [Haematococcus lacustris]
RRHPPGKVSCVRRTRSRTAGLTARGMRRSVGSRTTSGMWGPRVREAVAVAKRADTMVAKAGSVARSATGTSTKAGSKAKGGAAPGKMKRTKRMKARWFTENAPVAMSITGSCTRTCSVTRRRVMRVTPTWRALVGVATSRKQRLQINHAKLRASEADRGVLSQSRIMSTFHAALDCCSGSVAFVEHYFVGRATCYCCHGHALQGWRLSSMQADQVDGNT